VNRRGFIALLSGAAASRASSARVQGSASSRPLIAYLAGGRQAATTGFVSAFQEGLQELGYKDGRNIDIAYRFAEGQVERLVSLAGELVKLNPKVFLAGAVDAAVATKSVTATIPIVTAVLADPLNLGLVTSYPRPGGTITGIMPYVDGLPAKQMELAREVVPGAAKVGLLGNMNDPKAPHQRQELEDVARTFGIKVILPEVRSPEDVDGALHNLMSARVDVVIVMQTTMLLSARQQISAVAAALRLPAIYGYREHVIDGGLISYGVDLRWCFHRAATYVHKILNGASPGDLPVEFPTKLEMVVNLKAAKALGVTIPPLILARADEVIE
jgi:putative ABC transport system substrate-binding protein